MISDILEVAEGRAPGVREVGGYGVAGRRGLDLTFSGLVLAGPVALETMDVVLRLSLGSSGTLSGIGASRAGMLEYGGPATVAPSSSVPPVKPSALFLANGRRKALAEIVRGEGGPLDGDIAAELSLGGGGSGEAGVGKFATTGGEEYSILFCGANCSEPPAGCIVGGGCTWRGGGGIRDKVLGS